jgi:tRNA G26 N,N-dimethylase Trm1
MKLLSPKVFAEYTPEEYHSYIKSLHKVREYVSTKKEQKDLKVRAKRKKDGTLSIVTKRSPPYVTEKEIEKISAESSIPQSELFLVLRERGFFVTGTHRDAARISGEIAEFPF